MFTVVLQRPTLYTHTCTHPLSPLYTYTHTEWNINNLPCHKCHTPLTMKQEIDRNGLKLIPRLQASHCQHMHTCCWARFISHCKSSLTFAIASKKQNMWEKVFLFSFFFYLIAVFILLYLLCSNGACWNGAEDLKLWNVPTTCHISDRKAFNKKVSILPVLKKCPVLVFIFALSFAFSHFCEWITACCGKTSENLCARAGVCSAGH